MTVRDGTVSLLPCPFCGGRGLAGTTLDNMGYVICASDTCWGMAAYLPTEAEAIAAWNSRSVPSEPVEVKALEWATDGVNFVVRHAFGSYEVRKFYETWDLLCDGRIVAPKVHGVIKTYPTADEAKAAAQTDFDQHIRSALTYPASKEVTPAMVEATHRHKKRGTEYVLIGIGKMQTNDWCWIRGAREIVPVDMDEVAIYRSVDDASLWVRPREEFEDGRFEALTAALEVAP